MQSSYSVYLETWRGTYEAYPILAVTAYTLLGEFVGLNWQNSSCV